MPTYASLERQMVVFSEDGLWIKPFGLRKREKALILILYNESLLTPMMEKKKYRKRKENHFYNQKKKGKEL